MSSNQASYAINYYGHLMTKPEKRAYSQLAGTMKATMGRSGLQAQREARSDGKFSRWLCNDPEILRLTRDGYESFVQRTADRILAESREKVFLNCCPRCHELARTPKAQQCRFCGFDWHPETVG
jgi:hypothetical protein